MLSEETLLVVDGYNIIHQWACFQKSKLLSLEDARDHLISLLAELKAATRTRILVVFDGQGLVGDDAEILGVRVKYSPKGKTADSIIEKISKEKGKKESVVVATSDGVIQQQILGYGALRVSARELEKYWENMTKQQEKARRLRNGSSKKLSGRIPKGLEQKLRDTFTD